MKIKILFPVIIVIVLLLSTCGKMKTYLIGYAGPLTGKYSDLGVHARNGVQLALKHFKESRGNPDIKLIIKDDKSTKEGAVEADKELIAEGVTAIIGHITSGQGIEAIKKLKNWKGVMVSPTISTPELKGIEDNFFRVMLANTDRAIGLSNYVVDILKMKSVVAVGDEDNLSYVKTFIETFSEHFKKSGSIINIVYFSSSKRKDWNDIIATIKSHNPEGILVAASARDTALLAQNLHALGISKRIICPAWPGTKDLLAAGGKAVENLIFTSVYNGENDYPPFKQFEKFYFKKFGYAPNFAACYGYEAMTVVLTAIKESEKSGSSLKECLLKEKKYEGIISPFSLDSYGDAQRPAFIMQVKNGKFVFIKTIETGPM